MKKQDRQGQDEGEMLRLASLQFQRALRDLSAVLEELEAGEGGAPDRTKTVAVDVRKAIQTVFEERHRIEKLGENASGNEVAGWLDLETARAEIGRRLSRLREAGGKCGVFRDFE